MNSKSGLFAGLAGLGLCLVLTLVYLGSGGFPRSDQTQDQAGQRPERKRQQVLKGESGPEAREPQEAHRTALPEHLERQTDSQPSKSQAGKSGGPKRNAPAQPENPIETAIKAPLWEEVAESLRRSYKGYENLKVEGKAELMRAYLDVLYHLLPDIPKLVEEGKLTIKRETAPAGSPFTATVSTSRYDQSKTVVVRISSKQIRLSFDIQQDMVPEEVWRGIAMWDAKHGRRK